MHYVGVSNAIKYDSLLLAALARTLSDQLQGRSVRGMWLDRAERSLLLRLGARTRKTADTWLHWRLNPSSGDLTVRATPREPAGATVQVAPGTAIAAIYTLPDERVLCIDLNAGDAAGGFVRRVIIELVGTRWNAIALGADDAVTALLQVRERAGTMMRPGARYQPPEARHRAGMDAAVDAEAFATIVRGGGDEDLRRTIVREIAYTSPMNATYIVTPLIRSIDEQTIAEAYRRYTTLLASDAAFILPDGRGQPYPSAVDRSDAVATTDLVTAFDVVASADAAPAAAPESGTVDAAVAALHERIRRIDEKVARMEVELRDATADSTRMRGDADLLFAQLHAVPRGAADVELDNFQGGTARIVLDPSLSATDNASRLYEQAKRRDLAAERVPSMIADATTERVSLVALQQAMSEGTASPADIDRWSREHTTAREAIDEVPLPYRRYRTSGGFEVRAGRNSRANDELTFRHASPNDIWLHARDLAGAHVVLRWTDRDANPPARDLAEAAVIAAVNSRGRTSGMVPVDWTRRKYVRKPRKAPAGRVVVERAKTVFVEPDAALERRLYWP